MRIERVLKIQQQLPKKHQDYFQSKGLNKKNYTFEEMLKKKLRKMS